MRAAEQLRLKIKVLYSTLDILKRNATLVSVIARITGHLRVTSSLTALVVLSVVIVAGCTPDHPMSTFDAQGPVAQRQLDLFMLIFWIALVVFVLVGGWLLYTVIRFRRKSGQGIPHQTHGNTKLEITWTVIPAAMLAILAVPTVIGTFYITNTPDGNRLDIEVTAHQWWWEVEYPESGVTTSNEIHIPVDMVVNVDLISTDVLHSFWVPKLAGKLDIIPGRTTTMWLQADAVGEYYGQCAEFCGESHAWMRFRVFVDTAEEFEAWQEAQLAQAVVPSTPEETEGAGLFLSKGCVACHSISGVPGAVGVRGPNLSHVGSRSTLGAGIMDMTVENIAEWLTDPNKLKPGNIMSLEAPVYTNPDLSLSTGEIAALSSYIQSLK